MEKSNLLKKIVVKIIIIFFLMIILAIQYFYSLRSTSSDANSLLDTGDARMELDPKIYLYSDIEYFFRYVERKEYEKAYNLLSDECKNEIFNNDLNEFSNKMKLCINSDICEKKVLYTDINESIEKRKKIYIIKSIVYFEKMNENYKENLDTYDMNKFFEIKNFNFKIIEEKPFEFKMYLELVEG